MVKVRKDLTGMKFGRWLVLEQAEDHIEPSGNHCAQWLCLCDCGTKKIINGYVLRRGVSKSCGCLSQEIKSKTHKNRCSYSCNGFNIMIHLLNVLVPNFAPFPTYFQRILRSLLCCLQAKRVLQRL